MEPDIVENITTHHQSIRPTSQPTIEQTETEKKRKKKKKRPRRSRSQSRSRRARARTSTLQRPRRPLQLRIERLDQVQQTALGARGRGTDVLREGAEGKFEACGGWLIVVVVVVVVGVVTVVVVPAAVEGEFEAVEGGVDPGSGLHLC